MRNWEVSNFYQYKNYDKLINLDGGSSSQIWLNGRGPLHDWTGYPLVDDNQGPYFSRLVSSFVMLIPKLHTEEIGPYSPSNGYGLELDNSHITIDYSEDIDIHKDKAYISLAPNLEKLYTEENGGIVAGNFLLHPHASGNNGGILFSMVEETYYPDTEGLAPVIPEFRNFVVIGVGNIPGKLKDALYLPASDEAATNGYHANLSVNDQAIYYIKARDGKVVDFAFDVDHDTDFLFDSQWHSFALEKAPDGSINLTVDNASVIESNAKYFDPGIDDLFMVPEANDAMIGAINVDGRFVTGNARMMVDNILIAVGETGYSRFSVADRILINADLSVYQTLPDELAAKYVLPGVYAFQFEEGSGMHSFAIAESNEVRMYGLNLNVLSNEIYGASGGGQELSHFAVYPNPVEEGEVTIQMQAARGGMARIELHDLSGKELLVESRYLVKGENKLVLEKLKTRLRPGIYLLDFTFNNKKYTERILIK
jgi:hypothetical protein